MKKIRLTIMTAVFLFGGFGQLLAQVEVNSAASENLDLYAVGELFRDSENLEKFEQSLNNPVNAVNNLDLNDDNEIDFIRVTEQTKGDLRLVVLQAILGENEFQDVATIAVERESGDRYNLQIQGDAIIYGANYYVVPANNNFSVWRVVRWLFQPNYRVYVSPYGYKIYPHWWSPRRPVAINVYRTRAAVFTGRNNFITTKTVRAINKINYHPRTSTVVKRTTAARQIRNVNQSNGGSGGNNRVTVTKTKTTVVKKGKRN